jgi:hypothetical protein
MRKTNNSTFGNCGMLIDGILNRSGTQIMTWDNNYIVNTPIL